jgi:integrase
MIEDMQLRNFATTTQRSYTHYVADFAKHFNRSPQDLDPEAVRQYQLYLAQERKLSPQSINTIVSAVQFVYLITLEMPWDKHDFPRARLEEKLPVVLAPTSEAVSLKPSDIDSRRMLIHVEHGKGGKDRYAMLSACLLEILRAYFRLLRPVGPWLFPSWRPHLHLTAGAVRTACREAWKRSGPDLENAGVRLRCGDGEHPSLPDDSEPAGKAALRQIGALRRSFRSRTFENR